MLQLSFTKNGWPRQIDPRPTFLRQHEKILRHRPILLASGRILHYDEARFLRVAISIRMGHSQSNIGVRVAG
jgi:hypothetical protein